MLGSPQNRRGSADNACPPMSLLSSFQHVPESTALHLACKQVWNNNRAALVKSLLQQEAINEGGMDILVNAKDKKYGRTPLHTVLSGIAPCLKTIQVLIEHGADVNAVDDNGMTPLLWACSRNPSLTIIQYLIDNANADVKCCGNYHNATGTTPIHAVCRWGDLEMLKFLVSKGAYPNRPDYNGDRPIHTASTNLNKLRYLVEDCGVDVNSMSGNKEDEVQRTELHVACSGGNGDLTRVEFFMEHGADLDVVDSRGETPIDRARREEQYCQRKRPRLEVFKYLEKCKALLDVCRDEKRDQTALLEAASYVHNSLEVVCQRGHVWAVRELLLNQRRQRAKTGRIRTGGTITGMKESIHHYYKKTSPLELAISAGHLEVAELLVAHLDNDGEATSILFDRTWTGNNLLHLAAIHGRVNTIRWLLDKGVGLLDTNQMGETVLHVAIRAGHISVIRMLLIDLICSREC